MSAKIDVIATAVSGSISDWKKVERIVPLFAEHGFEDVTLHAVEGHGDARSRTREVVGDGSRLIISAGGSGTFNAVLEGCCDAAVGLEEIRLGFLRKGSADLLGKVLGMPDEIEAAIAVFARAIERRAVMPCDVLEVRDASGEAPVRHFVGYGGAELFGRIPHYTENRFMKWYKGVLGQLFGDLGPFTTGMTLAMIERLLKTPFTSRRWRLEIDGREVPALRYQALILMNGHLGPDMGYTDDALGSGRFHLFALRNLGMRKLPAQARHARAGTIMDDPERWGMDHHEVVETLRLAPDDGRPFPVNVDGSTLICREAVAVRRCGRIDLIAGAGRPAP